ncbi:Hypothetical predicted protein [Pelobates cultripes]|uniref:DUF3719 domain-containing protein n=1 Tax=Pelobates cultripes TaxID=61616 RepID=A0AAD1TD83_PELCU|nr:Hypothetical predicted protein [Pelobates cultripes]
MCDLILRMISRYKRKPVSQNLQINQFLTKAIENHPLPEEADSFSISHSSDQYEIASKWSSESDVSDTSQFSRADAQDSWSESQRGTGFSTDNSSVISWGFDEFDQAATRQVQRIFTQIDELLYERKTSSHVQDLQEECQEWTAHFPHLRIKGMQIVTPLDDGYSWHISQPCDVSESVVAHSGTHEKDTSEFGILGTKLKFSSKSHPSTPVYFFLSGEEDQQEDDVGILLSEGIMEEYLAFDSRDMEDELFEKTRNMSLDSLKMGYPPISPKHCNKEAVLAYLFDDVWREVVGCLEELICRHWEESFTDDDCHGIVIKTTRVESVNPHAQFQLPPLTLPPVFHAKPSAISTNLNSNDRCKTKVKKSGKPSHANRSHGGSISSSRNLNDLILIHGFPLQQRNLHLDSDEKSPLRPTSAALISGKPRSVRLLEQSSSSLSCNVSSARRRNPPRTLHPINNSSSRAGTPKMEDVIRGTRLHATNDQPSSSPVSFTRNNLLPPIATSDLDHQSMPGSRGQTPDNQLGRSFIVYDHTNLLRRRGSDGLDSRRIGVTGVNIGVTSSSLANSTQWGHSSNVLREGTETLISGIPLHLSLKSSTRGGFLTGNRQRL